MIAPLLGDASMDFFVNICITGLTTGILYALIALGYTMVYGIVELINFAHGDLFMLGCFLAWTLVGWIAVGAVPGSALAFVALGVMLLVVPVFCAVANFSVDWLVYKPLRNAPKLAPLVSAIGVSFIFMNLGEFWGGSQDINFPTIIPETNLLGADSSIQFTSTDLLVVAVTLPAMLALTLFVKFTSLGRAMRATAQNPTAAQLMGVNVNRVIAVTFLIGGTLAGIASVIYALKIKTIGFQMGFQNGLYAFTAAVLGGIGNIPGAVLGSILIGMTYSLASGYIDARWATAMIFMILIVVLVFRPSGLLGARLREKV
jgi:branched-chain amino acid transport system permease protein